MNDRSFRTIRMVMIALILVAFAPTTSAAGLDLITPDGRSISVAGVKVRVLAEGEPVGTVEPAAAAGPQGEVWHVGPVAPGTPTEGQGPEVAPVEPIATDAESAGDARAERNAAEVARLMPWIGAIAGLTLLVMVCAAIGGAWSRRRSAAKAVPAA